MFIQTERTQDPATLRFLPGRQILATGTVDVVDRTQARASPLAERLMAIPGVAKLFFGEDSIAVTKDSGDWRVLKPMIFGAIIEHFQSGAPIVRPAAAFAPAHMPDRPQTGALDNDLCNRVRNALHEVIDPELGYNIADLGLIYDVAIETPSSVRVTMTTTTPGCPATNYLGQGVRDKVAGVPGVTSVKIKLTYEPPWTPEMMSRAAKKHFGIT